MKKISEKPKENYSDDLLKVRVDKWLWAIRKYKTRTLAGSACNAGNVRINGVVVKASTKVKTGDEVRALTPGGRKILKVLGLAEKRGPASLAVSLFEDLTPPEPKEIAAPRFERGSGRPTKKDRRKITKLRGW